MAWSMGLLGDVSPQINFVASSVVNATVIPFPAETQVGDILVLSSNGGAFTTVEEPDLPAGWTQAVTGRVNGVASKLMYKIAEAGDLGSSVTLTPTYGSSNRKVMLVFRASFSVSLPQLSVVSPKDSASGADPAPLTIDLATVTSPVIAFANWAGSTTTYTPSGSPSMELTTNGSVFLGHTIFMSNPVDITVDMPDTGLANAMLCFGLVVTTN